MSSRRMRPPTPVPGTVATSMPCSAASLRTNGDNSRPPAPSRPTGAATVAGLAARGLSACGRTTAVASRRDHLRSPPPRCVPAPYPPAPSPRRRPGCPAAVPSYGLGISESTLSVDTSNSGSSNATSSPTAFNQVPIVPSVTDSPSFGMVISKTSPVADEARSAASSVVGPSDPPTDGAEGSLSDRPPAAATPCAAEGSRFGTVAPFPPIRMIAAPTETVSPSCARTSRTTPSYELGTSVSTLSVDTSNSGSSNSTSSPTCLEEGCRSHPRSPTHPTSAGSQPMSRRTFQSPPERVSAVQRPAGECNHRLADCLG